MKKKIIKIKKTETEMFEFIKNLGKKRMIKQLKGATRTKKIENLEQVKQIGVIFRVADEYDWNVIYHFIKVMEGAQKRVSVVGLQEADTELNYIITHSNTIVCREKEDLNFWGVPKEEKVKPFLDTHFDVLIDTTNQPDFFGQYLTLSSDADLRVARIDTADADSVSSSDIYDMMIHSEGTLDMKDYLNNVVNYLSAVQK